MSVERSVYGWGFDNGVGGSGSAPLALRKPQVDVEYERGEQWQDSALCAQTDPTMWYPEGKGQGRSPAKTAKQICAECEVSAQCLESSIENVERWGIWGGLDEDQRLPLINDRLEQKRAAGLDGELDGDMRRDSGDEWERGAA